MTSLLLDVSKEEEAEEAERINALLQRKNLLRDLGVVDQVYQMLHGAQSQPDPTQLPHEKVNISFHNTHGSINKVWEPQKGRILNITLSMRERKMSGPRWKTVLEWILDDDDYDYCCCR